MSSNYFGDLVKRTTGETAGNHIRRFIVEKTKDKLIGGNSISQIAYDLGFEYPQHLSRLFKKQEGCTPTETPNGYKRTAQPPVPTGLTGNRKKAPFTI